MRAIQNMLLALTMVVGSGAVAHHAGEGSQLQFDTRQLNQVTSQLVSEGRRALGPRATFRQRQAYQKLVRLNSAALRVSHAVRAVACTSSHAVRNAIFQLGYAISDVRYSLEDLLYRPFGGGGVCPITGRPLPGGGQVANAYRIRNLFSRAQSINHRLERLL